MKVPEIQPVTQWPPEVQKALMELVAFTVNQQTPMLNFNLKDLKHEGLELGDFRITIEKISSDIR